MTLENLYLEKSRIDKVEDFRSSENLVQKGKKILTSIVIPLYNEENSIKGVIDRIPHHRLYEIVIVDDGSTDNSVERIKEITNRKIKLIRHEKNQGYGAALLTGFKHATGDIIITMDSDGQHNPEEIPYLAKPIINNQADLVVGSRYLGKFNYKYPLYARVGEYFIRVFFRMLYLQRVHDNQCGFRAFKKDIKKILGNIRNTGRGFSTELLFTAAFNQLKIVETPVSANPRQYGTSHVNLIRILRSISSCILHYIFKKMTHRRQSLESKFNFNQISKRAIKNFELPDFKANVFPKDTYTRRERLNLKEEIKAIAKLPVFIQEDKSISIKRKEISSQIIKKEKIKAEEYKKFKQDYKIGINSNIRQPTIIYPRNEIGDNFQTGHFVTIRENNKIGNNVSIGSHSNIEHHIIIEDNVRIHSNCFVPEFSILKHDCWLGPNVVLCNAKYPKSIGVKRNLVGPTIKKYAKIGANSTILSGLIIGKHALIGAGTVVVKNVEDYAIVTGNPGKKIRDIRNLYKYQLK